VRFRLGLLTGAGIGLLAVTAVLIGVRQRTRTLRLLLDQARHEARHDRLTGLPNREQALDLLTEAVAMVGLLDLDDFKTVNDRYGHHIGDQLLITIAQRLRTAIGPHAQATRLSGDEFALIWWRTPADPLQAARILLQHVSAPITIEGHRLQPAASLGLALPGPHAHGIALLPAADHAMYEAKAAGRANTPPNETPLSHTRIYTGQYPPPPVDRRRSPRRRTHHRGPRIPPSPRPPHE
jgi:diguanylate cyclase (GGDEF)-like protein